MGVWKLVVAGGRVLDPSPGRTKAALAAAGTLDADSTPDDLASALLRIRGRNLVENAERENRNLYESQVGYVTYPQPKY